MQLHERVMADLYRRRFSSSAATAVFGSEARQPVSAGPLGRS